MEDTRTTREARLAARLRENLRRRKAQARAQAQTQAKNGPGREPLSKDEPDS